MSDAAPDTAAQETYAHAMPEDRVNAAAEGDDSLIRAAPGLMRIAATAWLRTAEWTAGAAVHATERLARAAVSGESAAELLEELRMEIRENGRRLLGIVDSELSPDGGPGETPKQKTRVSNSKPDMRGASLRDRGAELLRQSADLAYEEPTHPAYERILSELAPDEGRILRLLAAQGAHPALDVRTWRPLDVGSELVALGLSMIGAQAGVRYLDRVPAYLDNLNRLGLIWFSREPLQDPTRYQVLEAQPDVVDALRKAGRGRTVRRSIHLTPFGHGFCDAALPLDTAELDALPGDASPDGQAS
jgi:abortive infection alpha-like protein